MIKYSSLSETCKPIANMASFQKVVAQQYII